MKNILTGWFVVQFVVIALCGWAIDLQPHDKDRKVNCSELEYYGAITVIDLAFPLIQFSSLGVRDCL